MYLFISVVKVVQHCSYCVPGSACVCHAFCLQPFWPMGTGCARGFLAAFDTAWMVKGWAKGKSPLEILAERCVSMFMDSNGLCLLIMPELVCFHMNALLSHRLLWVPFKSCSFLSLIVKSFFLLQGEHLPSSTSDHPREHQ